MIATSSYDRGSFIMKKWHLIITTTTLIQFGFHSLQNSVDWCYLLLASTDNYRILCQFTVGRGHEREIYALLSENPVSTADIATRKYITMQEPIQIQICAQWLGTLYAPVGRNRNGILVLNKWFLDYSTGGYLVMTNVTRTMPI